MTPLLPADVISRSLQAILRINLDGTAVAKVAKNLCRFTAGGRPTLTEQM